MKHSLWLIAMMAAWALAVPAVAQPGAPLDIGTRRELYVDSYLVDRLSGARTQFDPKLKSDYDAARAT